MIEYELIYSSRKSLCLTVKDNGSLVVRAPRFYPKKQIEAFLLSKEDWISNARKRVSKQKVFPSDPVTVSQLRQQAADILPPLVSFYGQKMQLFPKKVKINSAKKRFGSCSDKGILNFSLYLMLYPQKAMEYVVVHELAHLKYMNHSKEFYLLIEQVLPDYKERIRLLKQ